MKSGHRAHSGSTVTESQTSRPTATSNPRRNHPPTTNCSGDNNVIQESRNHAQGFTELVTQSFKLWDYLQIPLELTTLYDQLMHSRG
jgi:hypothetical protein